MNKRELLELLDPYNDYDEVVVVRGVIPYKILGLNLERINIEGRIVLNVDTTEVSEENAELLALATKWREIRTDIDTMRRAINENKRLALALEDVKEKEERPPQPKVIQVEFNTNGTAKKGRGRPRKNK